MACSGADLSWPSWLVEDLERNDADGRVGTRLLSETGRVRVWSIDLAPGERLGFHRHVLDYFWTALTDGRALSRRADGTTLEVVYRKGATEHFRYAKGEYKVHDLENTGAGMLSFLTVEFLDSENAPLTLGRTPESAPV